MQNSFSRTELLIGKEALNRLKTSRVAVFGIGGVGGYVVEALARSGIGAIDLCDSDTVDITNLNRQIIALHSTIGRDKVDAARERILQINPDCKVAAHKVFYLPETEELFDFSLYDYIVDAVDTVTAKLAIVENAEKAGVPVISSMGTGNKMDPAALEVADIYSTSVCPLAKVMRHECRKRGIGPFKVVYSREEPLVPIPDPDAAGENLNSGSRRSVPGSTAFVPAAAGLIIASEVVKDLIRKDQPEKDRG